MNLASVFDLNGPEFLGLYVVLFVFALAWSIRRRKNVYARFSLPGAERNQLTDPYEIAWLAGGVPRCAQVAVVKLISSGAVEWKRTRILRESLLVANGSAEAGFNEMERALYSAILGRGQKGLKMTEVPPLIATRISGIESRLAKLGLRPTVSETRGRGCLIILPLFALMGFGAVKMVVGMTRDKPILYLVILLAITVIVAAIIAAHKKKLTPAGENLLSRMRAGREAQGDVLCSVALFGAASGLDPSLADLDTILLKDISKMGNNTGSSGCGGTSTGCGGGSSGCSSGCGGGGCGGCGGGD